MNKVEQGTVQDSAGKDIKLVSINSFQFNKNCSILTTRLKTSAGKNNIIVPYKIDLDSYDNIMPAHMFKNCFQR